MHDEGPYLDEGDGKTKLFHASERKGGPRVYHWSRFQGFVHQKTISWLLLHEGVANEVCQAKRADDCRHQLPAT